MLSSVWILATTAAGILSLIGTGCGKTTPPVTYAATNNNPPTAAPARREIRATGTISAVHFANVQVPRVVGQTGQNGRMTLTHLVPNGTRVKKGDSLAIFDRTLQADNARDAKAKFDDLSHQVDQKQAQNNADAAKRRAELQKAQADLAKAEIQLQKAELLSDIDRKKNEVKLADARDHVASLKKSNQSHDVADAAALRILELQRDRQKVSLDRALSNVEKLELRAGLDGMVAYDNIWRNGQMGHPQEGDQLWPGQNLMRIFDPSEMQVSTQVGEPDGGLLTSSAKAEVRLDAYPDLVFTGHFVSASPVAASAIGSPLKAFAAVFKLDGIDNHLLPDMSAAVIVRVDESAAQQPPAPKETK